VALSVLGWYWLVQLFKNEKVKLVVLGVVAITFLKPGIWSIANHPYEYMYFNEIAGGIKGANGEYETDYWNQTPRAAFEWLVKNQPEILNGKLRVSSNNIQEALKTFVPEGKDVMYKWTREYEWANDDWTYAIWTTRTLSKNQILDGYWPPKGTIHEIKVDGVTIAAVVKAANNYSFRGHEYLKKNRGDSAFYFYQLANAYNPKEEEYVRGMANALKGTMQLDSSMMFYKKAIEMRDGNYEAYQSLGELYYYKAMQANQTNPDKKMVDLAFENLGLAFKYKKNTSAPLMMGEIKLALNQAEEARTYFYKFLETYGNEGRGYLGLAKAQSALGETDSAMMNLDFACQLDPKNPEPFYLLGNELKKAGKANEAEKYFQQYMKLSGMPLQ
jgi:tetratricopeptide (TPR) repeat protein